MGLLSISSCESQSSRWLQSPHLFITQASAVSGREHFVDHGQHLILVPLQCAVDGQIVGGVDADEFEVVDGEVFEHGFHLFKGFERVEQLELAGAHLIVQGCFRDGGDGHGGQVAGLHGVGDFGGGDGVFARARSSAGQTQQDHGGEVDIGFIQVQPGLEHLLGGDPLFDLFEQLVIAGLHAQVGLW